MIVLRDPKEMRDWSLARRAEGKRIGFVPTMGALHDGHASLMRAAARENDIAVLSIFVNPAQFAPHEDFGAYPRTWEADTRIAESTGMAAIYFPEAARMYPEDYSTYVTVEGVSEGLCGASRPHFFRGVATVVCKLFNAVLPHRAYFGRKDAQQCAVIKRMTRDLDMDIEIVEMPIVREPDGLAMSSRNAYLGPEERVRARCLSRALEEARALAEAGETDPEAIRAALRDALAEVDIDYIEVVDPASMRPVTRLPGEALAAIAARVGQARLIDNAILRVGAGARDAALAGQDSQRQGIES